MNTDGDQHELSLDKLDAMEQVEFSTTTIWTEGIVRFSGVPLMHLLDSLKAEGRTLRMSALNDYSVEMQTSELENDAPIVATRINGQTLPVRERVLRLPSTERTAEKRATREMQIESCSVSVRFLKPASNKAGPNRIPDE